MVPIPAGVGDAGRRLAPILGRGNVAQRDSPDPRSGVLTGVLAPVVLPVKEFDRLAGGGSVCEGLSDRHPALGWGWS